MSHVSYHLGDLRGILAKEKPSSVCLVTSAQIASRMPAVLKKLRISPQKIILVPDGETAKTWETLKKVLAGFSRLCLGRSAIVIAFGGGSIGDLTGLAASIYMRGIRYIQIPTTLVAQVDSAYGGKTGINFQGSKNQIGSFHEPVAVISDPQLLRSLSIEQIVDGLGEIIKCGLIMDQSILFLLKRERIETLGKSKNLLKIIRKAVSIKQNYSTRDFKDRSLRYMLNFGHTAGHAIELAYSLSHGYAVIIGMLEELTWTESLGITSPSVRANLLDLLGNLGIKIQKRYVPDFQAILHDKKVQADAIVLPVVIKEGYSKLVTIPMRRFAKLIQKT